MMIVVCRGSERPPECSSDAHVLMSKALAMLDQQGEDVGYIQLHYLANLHLCCVGVSTAYYALCQKSKASFEEGIRRAACYGARALPSSCR